MKPSPSPAANYVDLVWDALRERVCSSKLEAKRCVMVGREDIEHALIAASRGTRALTEEDQREIRLARLLIKNWDRSVLADCMKNILAIISRLTGEPSA